MLRIVKTVFAFAMLFVLCHVFVASPLFAEDKSDAIIKYRIQIMKADAHHLTAIFAVLDSNIPINKHVSANARAIADSADLMTLIFPKGSITPESRSKPEIWEAWNEFEAASADLKAASLELAEASDSGDLATIKRLAGRVGKACSECHNTFRKKK